MLFFENSYITIKWDEVTNWVLVERRGYTSGEDFKLACNKIIELLEQKKASKELSDVRTMRVVSPPDQKWFTEDYLPRAREAGLRYIAIIVPASIIAKMSLDAVIRASIEGSNNLLKMEYFDSIEAAEVWLNTMK